MTSAYDQMLTAQTLGRWKEVKSQPVGDEVPVCYSLGEILHVKSPAHFGGKSLHGHLDF